MAMFNSYVKLPEGKRYINACCWAGLTLSMVGDNATGWDGRKNRPTKPYKGLPFVAT